LKSLSARFVKDESGATAIEYGLIAGILSVGVAGALPSLRDAVIGTINAIIDVLP